jgi:hypothetical protein
MSDKTAQSRAFDLKRCGLGEYNYGRRGRVTFLTLCFFFLRRNSPRRVEAASLLGFLDHTRVRTHTHTHTRARTRTRIHPRAHTPRTHARTHTHARTYTNTHPPTHTHPVWLLRKSDQQITGVAAHTTHNKRNRPTSKSSAGFEWAIPVIKWLQDYTFDRTASVIGWP